MEKKPLKLNIKKKPLKLKIKKKEEERQGQEKSTTTVTTPEISLPAGGGIKIIFQNAKIHAEKVIIKRVER